MDSDDFPKKRVMRGALDSCCGMWAPIIRPGAIEDDIRVPTRLPSATDWRDQTLTSDLARPVVMKKV